MAVEFKTLTFPNTESGRRKKIRDLQMYTEQGWEIVSESITQGKFRGKTACCLSSLICLPAGFCAGSTDGDITVTLKRDSSQKSSADTLKEGIKSAVASAPKAKLPESPKKTYEPVIGVETGALIKRAFLFLEDGENYEAERYIE